MHENIQIRLIYDKYIDKKGHFLKNKIVSKINYFQIFLTVVHISVFKIISNKIYGYIF